MFTAICDIASITELHLRLDQLSDWADEWQLSIALNKCSVLHVGKNNPIHVYSLRAELLQGASEAIDLGVIIDDKLRFTSHYAFIAKKAHQRASLILRCFKCRDPVLLTKTYLVYVRSLLEYCSPVWAPVYIKDIALLESVQRRFTKRISGMSDLNYLQRLKTLNLETLEARRLKTDLLTMFKILNNMIAMIFSVRVPLRIPEATVLSSLSQFAKIISDCSHFLVDALTAGTLCQIMLFTVSLYIHSSLV